MTFTCTLRTPARRRPEELCNVWKIGNWQLSAGQRNLQSQAFTIDHNNDNNNNNFDENRNNTSNAITRRLIVLMIIITTIPINVGLAKTSKVQNNKQ